MASMGAMQDLVRGKNGAFVGVFFAGLHHHFRQVLQRTISMDLMEAPSRLQTSFEMPALMQKTIQHCLKASDKWKQGPIWTLLDSYHSYISSLKPLSKPYLPFLPQNPCCHCRGVADFVPPEKLSEMLLDHKLRMLRAWQSNVLSLRPSLQVVECPFAAKFDIHGWFCTLLTRSPIIFLSLSAKEIRIHQDIHFLRRTSIHIVNHPMILWQIHSDK